MKLTQKLTKEQIVALIQEEVAKHPALVKQAPNDLYKRLAYASKEYKKDANGVSKKDLYDLAKELITVTDKIAKATGNVNTVTGKPKSEPQKESQVKTAGDHRKLTKKGDSTKKSGEAVKTANKVDDKHEDNNTGFHFPAKFSKDGIGTCELASDIQNIDQLRKAVDKGEGIVFAFAWTKKDLKSFDYFQGMDQPTEFEDDMDLATPMYISEKDTNLLAYCLSAYTEAFYLIYAEDIEEEDGVRISQGIEYQIYRAK